MKKIVLLLAIIVGTACSKQDTPELGSKINLSANIEPITRVSLDQTGRDISQRVTNCNSPSQDRLPRT